MRFDAIAAADELDMSWPPPLQKKYSTRKSVAGYFCISVTKKLDRTDLPAPKATDGVSHEIGSFYGQVGDLRRSFEYLSSYLVFRRPKDVSVFRNP